jgi:outer membrane protein assembly factor BamD (BamD/ComL family)
MSVTGITSSLLSYLNQTSNENKPPIANLQEFKQDFQQLGQDLQSGNLSAAQADFATLEQVGPASLSNPSATNNPLAKAFQQLSQDLQSGNLSAAQQDYTQIQQKFQQLSAEGGEHHHHHHGGGGQIGQLFQQLGQDLQSGNLSGAQQTFATLQQDLQSLTANSGQSSSSSSSAASGVSVTV